MAEIHKHRVLHLTNGEHYAGIEKVLDLIARYLPAEGFEVGFVCLKPDKFPIMRQSQSTPLYKVVMRGKWDLRPAIAVAQLVRQKKYHLIHTHTARSALIGKIASILAGVPMVHHFHSPTTCDTTDKWRNYLNSLVEKISLLGISKAIAVSDSLQAYARLAGIPANCITVVRNGVPTRSFSSKPRFTPSVWHLGTVALFRPRKGLEVLIDALALLKREGLAVRLLAVGNFETKEYENQIKARANKLGLQDVIIWRGFQQDVDAELARMDLFILPSLFGEGLPMVVLEAMAVGLPIIVSDVKGISEVIRDRQEGLIFQAGNPQDLAAKITLLIRGAIDWQEIADRAYQRQVQHFSARNTIGQIAQIYRQILAEPHQDTKSRVAVGAVADRV